MTATETAAPVLDATAGARPVQCQAWLTCPGQQCQDSRPCPKPAAWRVSFRCEKDQCSRAAFVMLLCRTCSDEAHVIGPVLARRPL